MNKIQNVDIYSNDAGRFMVDVAEEGDSIDVVLNGSSEIWKHGGVHVIGHHPWT